MWIIKVFQPVKSDSTKVLFFLPNDGIVLFFSQLSTFLVIPLVFFKPAFKKRYYYIHNILFVLIDCKTLDIIFSKNKHIV